MKIKPSKPTPDFPLYAHGSGQWAKTIGGKKQYYGPWEDPQGALNRYLAGAESSKLPAVGKQGKPSKPAGFPLYPHTNGQWAKRVRGQVHYFGCDRQAALDRWLDEKDTLLAGRRPTPKGGLTVLGLVNHFLADREAKVKAGELKPRTLADYKLVTDRIVQEFGKTTVVASLTPDDFAKLRRNFKTTHGTVALTNDITRCRVVFGHAARFKVAVDYGDQFKKPTKKDLREARNARPEKFFEAHEIAALIAGASPQLRAMIYLGINCAFGNNDCATLQMGKIDLKSGRHSFPRPKTGIARSCPLWPETVAALRDAIELRPEPRSESNAANVFITNRGNTWERTKDDNPIAKEFAKLMKAVGLHKEGRGFYSLRHTFQTVGDSSGQPVAVQYVMGHAPKSDDMAAVYRAKTFEKNISAASEFVRAWLKDSNSSSQESPRQDNAA